MRLFNEIAGLPIIGADELERGRIKGRAQQLTHGFYGLAENAIYCAVAALSCDSDTRPAPAVRVIHNGCLVPKRGRHGKGGAVDLVGFELEDGAKVTLPNMPRGLACRVEAALRMWIPQVLGPWYDKGHVDHWHLDDRVAVYGLQRESRADVRFLQASLVYRLGRDLAIDGLWGPISQRTLLDVARAADVNADHHLSLMGMIAFGGDL